MGKAGFPFPEAIPVCDYPEIMGVPTGKHAVSGWATKRILYIPNHYLTSQKYGDGFSCAITAASATIGPVFPPSIPMIIYSMLSGASIGSLFLGGMVSGLLLGVALMVYIGLIAKRRNFPRGQKYTFKEFLKNTVDAFPALPTPVILLGGIYIGVMTPTEADAVAAIYGIVISLLFYRSLKFKGLLFVTGGVSGVSIIVLLLMTYIPDLVMVLPRLLG